VSLLPPDIRGPIEEGIANRQGGEVIVRSNALVARIFVCDGGVAWVNCSHVPSRLSDVLQREAGISRSDLNDVVEACRESGSQFGETLVQWGLIGQDMLRRCLQVHNRTHLIGVLQMPAPRMAMFIPHERSYDSEFLFSLDELVAHMPGPPVPEPSELDLDDVAEALASAAQRVQNSRLVTLVDLRRGAPVAVWPEHPDAHPLAVSLTDLVQEWMHGDSVTRLESGLRSSGLDDGRFAQKVVAPADDAVHAFVRSRVQPHLVMAVVVPAPYNLGLVLAMATRASDDFDERLRDAGVVDDDLNATASRQGGVS